MYNNTPSAPPELHPSFPTRVITQTSLFTLNMTLPLHAHKILSPTLMSHTSNFGSTLPKLNADTKSLPIPNELWLWNSRLVAKHSSRLNYSI